MIFISFPNRPRPLLILICLPLFLQLTLVSPGHAFLTSTSSNTLGTGKEVTQEESRKAVLTKYKELQSQTLSYRGNTAYLKAWAFANSDLKKELDQLRQNKKLRYRDLLPFYQKVHFLLNHQHKKEFNDLHFPVIKKIDILNSVVGTPLNQILDHNCYSSIIYAAVLADQISPQGVEKLLDEISQIPEDMNKRGGFFSSCNKDDKSQIKAVFHLDFEHFSKTKGTPEELVQFEAGDVIVFSKPEGGGPAQVIDNDKLYAHVALASSHHSLLQFWDIDKNKTSNGDYRVVEIKFKEMLEKFLKRTGDQVDVYVVKMDWTQYKGE